MVVPTNKLPLSLMVLAHAEGRIFQDQKMLDVIEPLRTDLLPRHHAADQHAQEGPVRDDEHGPLPTRHKMVQGFERTLLEVKEILFIGMFDPCIRPVLCQKSPHLQRFRCIPPLATDDGRAKDFLKQRVNDNRQAIPCGNASSGLRSACHIAGNHDLHRDPLEATGYAGCLAPSQRGERRMHLLVRSLLVAFSRSMPDEIYFRRL
jgi:hypothetical protein